MDAMWSSAHQERTTLTRDLRCVRVRVWGVLMPTSSRLHANAALTPRHRMLVAQLVVNDGWPISEAAARFQVSWPTVKRWVDRYLSGEPMHDRSSRPRTSPKKTPKTVTMRCVSLRMRLREGPVLNRPGFVRG